MLIRVSRGWKTSDTVVACVLVSPAVRVLCSGLGNQLVRSDEERMTLIAEMSFGEEKNENN